MDKKTIKITIDLGEVCQDLVSDCNLISKQLGENVDAEIKSDVQTPDNNETKGIICRAVTEAIGQVKYAAQRYLLVGRVEDSNTLERLGYTVSTTVEKTVKVPKTVTDSEGNVTYVIDADTGQIVYETQTMSVTEDTTSYEKQVFTFSIPNFNIAVTDALKSTIHKYIVDHTMWRFLQNQVNDKAGEYKALAQQEDYPDIISKLNARTNFHKANFA